MKCFVAYLTLFLAQTAMAFAPANPDDQATQQFFTKQCPGCSLAALQFHNNQQRALKVGSQITLKPGFYTTSHDEVPLKVKEAAKSVFSLIVLNEDESTYPEFFKHTLVEKVAAWKNSPDSQARRVAQVVQLFIDRCKDSALCRAPLQSGAIAGGSAVLMGASGTELWTAGHVFEVPFRQMLLRDGSTDVQTLVGRTFKVIVFNSEGVMVAHPYANRVTLAYSASREIVPLMNPNTAVDTLRFELEKPIGRGLEVASNINPGANIFSVGYPACTGCAAKYASVTEKLLAGTRFPHRDATPFDLQFTLGQVLVKDAHAIITNADANGGMSGGATLDEEGRVVGINSSVGVTISSPDFLADRRLRLARPAAWNVTIRSASL